MFRMEKNKAPAVEQDGGGNKVKFINALIQGAAREVPRHYEQSFEDEMPL